MTSAFGTVDYARYVNQRTQLQTVIDNASLAAAKGLSLSSATKGEAASVVQNVVDTFFDAEFSDAATDTPNGPRPSVKTKVNNDPLQVEVYAQQKFESIFGTAFGLKVQSIEAKSVAQIVGRPNLCILALNPSSNGTIDLQHKALITGNNCSVFSNSTHNIGIKAKSSARLTAATICSSGGFQQSGANFNPVPHVDCPQFDDPLAARVAPPTGKCDPTLPTKIFDSRQLQPGTYCQDLFIGNGAIVDLSEGTYVFKGARLTIDDNAELHGKNVGLYFDKGSRFHFAAKSKVSLEAPVSGPMAGLAIFTARDMPKGTINVIYSEMAQNLVGTIYMPTAELRIDGAAKIGGDAAYTAIVVHDLRIYGGPHIILNTDYAATDVPVPEGIKGAGQPVRLIQ